MSKVFIHPEFRKVYEKYPITLIDIGALGGIPDRWKKAEKYLKAVGFEPDERVFGQLSNTDKTVYIKTALSDSESDIELFVTKSHGSTSMFHPDRGFINQFPDAGRFDITGKQTVTAKRLDKALLGRHNIFDPDFIKIDVQGAELKILKGARELLDDSVFGIETEVEFVPLYLGQPLFSDVDVFLRDRGFYLFDLRRYFWKRNEGVSAGGSKGQLIFGEALYFKSYEALLTGIKDRDLNAEGKKAKVLKAISICVVYGISDYALYLTKRAHEDGLLSSLDQDRIHKAIGNKKKRIRFKGTGRLAKVLHRAYKYLRSGEFHFRDEELGNHP